MTRARTDAAGPNVAPAGAARGSGGRALRRALTVAARLAFCLVGAAAAAKTLPVAGPQALRPALTEARPGDTLLLAGGDYGELTLWVRRDPFVDFPGEVTLRSAEPADPARFTGMTLNGVRNMTFDGVLFDYVSQEGHSEKTRPFEIKHSRGVTIRNATFDGDVGRGVSAARDGYGAGIGLSVGSSRDVALENVLFDGWARAATFGGVHGLSITGSELRGMRSDGFNFVKVSDVTIAGNRFHSFRRAPGAGDHADMIQFWTLRTDVPSHGVVIRDNVFDSAGVAGTQTIFMRNEEVDSARAGTEMHYRDIRIENNLIRNAHLHGITVGEADGVVIRNNTLLQDGGLEDRGGVSEPAISVAGGSRDVTIVGNIAHRIVGAGGEGGGPGWTVRDNLVVQRASPYLPNFYDDLFLNARAAPGPGGRYGAAALRALPGGPADRPGLGANVTRFDTTPEALDGYILAGKAGEPGLEDRVYRAVLYGPQGRIDLSGAEIAWRFGEHAGTGAEEGGDDADGETARHAFDRAAVHEIVADVTLPDGRAATLRRQDSVFSALRLDAGFDGSARNRAAPGEEPEEENVRFVTAGGRDAVRLGRGFVRWPPDAAMRVGDAFTVTIAFARETAADRGMLASLPGVFSIAVGTDHVTASISTSAGGGRIRYGRGLPVGRWVTVRLSFSGAAGVATLWVDGAAAGHLRGLAGGVTHGGGHQLVLGDLRGDGFPGLVDEIRFESAASASGGLSGAL